MSAAHGLPDDLNALLVLEAVYIEGSVTRAARRLSLTQSAVSHRLRSLRDHFGDPLFVPSRGGLLPTERARALESPLRQALEGLRRALGTAVFDPATARRRFTIATDDQGEVLLMPGLERRLGAAAPSVSISFQRIGPDIADRLRERDVDLATLPRSIPLMPTIKTRILLKEEFVLLARRGHPELGRARRVSLERFVSLRHVLVAPRGVTDRGLVDDVLDGMGQRRHLAVITRHFLSAVCLTASTDLVQVVPTQLAAVALDLLDVQVHALPFSMPESAVVLAWHERAQDDPGHRWLREELASGAQELQRALGQRFAKWTPAPEGLPGA